MVRSSRFSIRGRQQYGARVCRFHRGTSSNLPLQATDLLVRSFRLVVHDGVRSHTPTEAIAILPDLPVASVPSPRFSLVIPAYNEARLLPRLLDSVDVARKRFSSVRSAVEVIVADNVSTDTTAAIAAARGCRVVRVTARIIAAVRNAGGREATGEILAFVDADSRIHPDTFSVIDQAMQSDRVVGGSTGCTLERWSPGLVATFAAMLPVIWLTGIDTGVVFARRTEFTRLGGYDESYPAGEDVVWLWRLKRDGAARSRRLVRLRQIKVVASTRKFDQHGDWHYFRFVTAAPRFFLGGRKLTGFWDRYWYRPDR